MIDKLRINGIVECPTCHGVLISNTGKIKMTNDLKYLFCWHCHKKFELEKVYMQREENKTIIYKENNEN